MEMFSPTEVVPKNITLNSAEKFPLPVKVVSSLY